MEKKDSTIALTENEFMTLLNQAQNDDPDAMLKLLQFFEPDMLRHVQFIQMPREDALQHMRLTLIELIQSSKLPLPEGEKGQA